MKKTALLLALLGAIAFVHPANAQTGTTKPSDSTSKSKMSTSKMSSKTAKTSKTKKTMPKHPKNEVTKLEKDRKTNNTVKQVTPDPKKSPGKHADNLSKNVNHEVNRESKDVNHFFQGKKKSDPKK